MRMTLCAISSCFLPGCRLLRAVAVAMLAVLPMCPPGLPEPCSSTRWITGSSGCSRFATRVCEASSLLRRWTSNYRLGLVGLILWTCIWECGGGDGGVEVCDDWNQNLVGAFVVGLCDTLSVHPAKRHSLCSSSKRNLAHEIVKRGCTVSTVVMVETEFGRCVCCWCLRRSLSSKQASAVSHLGIFLRSQAKVNTNERTNHCFPAFAAPMKLTRFTVWLGFLSILGYGSKVQVRNRKGCP